MIIPAILKEKIDWFASSLTVYYALGYCNEHGYMRGKIKVKNALNGSVFVIKTVKPIDRESARTIELRKEEIRKKRQKDKKKKNV